jgi:hypothetical protein
MLGFELTRIEMSCSYYTTEFSNRLLAKLMVAHVACVSVLDEYLSVGRGGLLATRHIFGISLSGRVRYISQFCIKVLMTASWGVGVAT